MAFCLINADGTITHMSGNNSAEDALCSGICLLHNHGASEDDSVCRRAAAILRNGKLSFEPGQKVGIVGRTGGGKLSLLRCLLGFLTCVRAPSSLTELIVALPSLINSGGGSVPSRKSQGELESIVRVRLLHLGKVGTGVMTAADTTEEAEERVLSCERRWRTCVFGRS